MNTRMKRRLIVVTGTIVVVLAVVLAIVASSTGYQSVRVAEALDSSMRDQRVQVSGMVVNDSFTLEGTELRFKIFDSEGNPSEQLSVFYEGGISATFGNGVTAICTGRIDSDGTLICSELVTKCPSKYESATDALSVSQLVGYGTSVEGKPVKITGLVEPGSINPVGQGDRLVLVDETTGDVLSILFDGALADDITDNSLLVVTGAIDSHGSFAATDISLKKD